MSFLFSFQIMTYFILTVAWNIATKGCFSVQVNCIWFHSAFFIYFNSSHALSMRLYSCHYSISSLAWVEWIQEFFLSQVIPFIPYFEFSLIFKWFLVSLCLPPYFISFYWKITLWLCYSWENRCFQKVKYFVFFKVQPVLKFLKSIKIHNTVFLLFANPNSTQDCYWTTKTNWKSE